VRAILAAEQAGKDGAAPQPSAEVMQRLLAYRWPGNLRQLANVLRTAALMAAGDPQITTAHLCDDFLEESQPAASSPLAASAPPNAPSAGGGASASLPTGTLEDAELEMIRAAVEAAGGNISAASKRLGIARNTIYRRLRWNIGH